MPTPGNLSNINYPLIRRFAGKQLPKLFLIAVAFRRGRVAGSHVCRVLTVFRLNYRQLVFCSTQSTITQLNMSFIVEEATS
jgi:hypothetical protein